jgi:hypothetical protein
VTAVEWWLLVAVLAASFAAVTAIAGLGPTADRIGRALGYASVGLVAAGLWAALG